MPSCMEIFYRSISLDLEYIAYLGPNTLNSIILNLFYCRSCVPTFTYFSNFTH